MLNPNRRRAAPARDTGAFCLDGRRRNAISKPFPRDFFRPAHSLFHLPGSLSSRSSRSLTVTLSVDDKSSPGREAKGKIREFPYMPGGGGARILEHCRAAFVLSRQLLQLARSISRRDANEKRIELTEARRLVVR